MTTEVIFCSLNSNCNHRELIMEVTSKLIERLSGYNHRNNLTNWATIFRKFMYSINCFCCYVIESGDSKKCIVISHRKSTGIKINLPQIMTLSIKREKVCAACPYLLFNWLFIVILTARSYRDCHWFFCFGNGTLLIFWTSAVTNEIFPYPWQISIGPYPM